MKIANAVRGVPFAEVKHGTIVQIFDTNSNLYIGVRGRWDAATRRPGEPPKRSKGGTSRGGTLTHSGGMFPRLGRT
jgi:hypothetical protein